MSEQQSSYRQIMKATSIFGGVQVFNIIIGIIRSKFIAVLLGPMGMGISSLLTTTISFIGLLTGFGLSTSAVKNVAAAHGSGKQVRISTIVGVFRRILWITGLLGTLLTAVLSSWLSQITFGNKDFTFSFIWISITLLFNQISAGQGVLLRGMRQIRYMAQSGMIGGIVGLITTIPVYFFFGLRGIVPGIIITSVTTLLLTWFYARKLNIKSIYVSKARTIAEGKEMLKMGFMISLSGMITLGASYLVRLYISNTGGVDQVGLYSAGFAIINTYVGMVFTAMSTDYYPRLSAVAHSNEKSTEVINQQAEIALLILSPLIMVFLIFINWVIIILYSAKFIPVNDMILYAALGMFFKASSWSIAFIFLAKGAGKMYFWNELTGNIYVLILNLIGYKLLGLTGLGISFMVGYIFYLAQVFVISRFKYNFAFNIAFYKIFGLQISLAICCFVIVKIIGSPFSYAIGSILIITSAFYSYKELDKRLDLKSIITIIRKKI